MKLTIKDIELIAKGYINNVFDGKDADYHNIFIYVAPSIELDDDIKSFEKIQPVGFVDANDIGYKLHIEGISAKIYVVVTSFRGNVKESNSVVISYTKSVQVDKSNMKEKIRYSKKELTTEELWEVASKPGPIRREDIGL